MPDGRVNNGNKGHSTKAKGIDKRRNPYREVVRDAVTPEDLKKVFGMLMDKALKRQDTKAAQLLIEYTVGKPSQEIDLNVLESINFNKLIEFGKSE